MAADDGKKDDPKDDDKSKGDGDAKDDGDEQSEDKDSDGDKKDSDDDQDDDDDKKPSALSRPGVRIALIVAALVILIGGGIWFYHYWTRGRYNQSTNDAYIRADSVTIAPKLAGYVEQVLVRDNQWVSPGQPLVKLDETDTRAQLEQAEAQVAEGQAAIAQARAQIRQQRAQIAATEAQLDGYRSSAFYAQRQVDRYTPLAARGAQTFEELDQQRQTRDQQNAQVRNGRAQVLVQRRMIATYQAQIASARAQIAAADAQVRQSRTNLGSTLLRSSIRGRVGNRTVRVGQYVQTGTRLMTVVPVSGIYLEANFKETQLGLMRIGQPATITVDAFSGGDMRGVVESFSPGTGSEFAVLPPQNATGNFTKIVQRVPVRIRIYAGPEAQKVLVPGMSVTVSVDTIGAKAEREAAKQEAERGEDRRERLDKQAVERDKRDPQPGPGR